MTEVLGDIAVTEDSLVQCVGDIRWALGPGRKHLRTLVGRGYRLGDPDATFAAPEPIRFVQAPDGVRLAWTVSGRGVPVLKAPNWISHLGLETSSGLWAPYFERLGCSARIVRLDQRGNGLSDWTVPRLTIDAMVSDLEVVAEAAGLRRFVLFGLSQGAAYSIAYAARHPERVRGVFLLGPRWLGSLASGDPEARRVYQAGLMLIRSGWGAEDPSYRRYFTGRIIPDASPELAREYDEFQRLSLPPENIEAYFTFVANLDVRAEAARLRVPVLILHSRGDRMVPPALGRELAALIPGARLVELDGSNHIPVAGTPAFDQALSAIEGFLAELGADPVRQRAEPPG